MAIFSYRLGRVFAFSVPRQQCYAWANRIDLVWFSALSRNQKFKHANKLTFLIILKKEQFE